MIPKITLFKHRNDRTLRISKYLLSKNRLGRHGLQSDTPSVKTIDVTRIRPTMGYKDNITHHLYFYKCPQVIDIIRNAF